MPRLNLYEQQTSAQGPRASGADFGAAPAQALEGAGNALYDIGERIQRRDELLAADQVMTDVDTWALTALDDFSKRQDITSQQSLPEFQNALKQKRAEALSKFSGRPEARAALERQLDNQLSQYGKSAISTKIKAGHALMTRAIDQQLDKSANQVGVAPQIMEDAIAENVAYVNSRKDAMSAEMYQAALTKAQAGPIQAAVMSHIQNGAWDAAEAVMADPRFSKLLAPEQVRPLRIEVAVGRGKAEKDRREVDQDRAALSYLLGPDVQVTPEMAAAAAGVSKMPMVQKLNVLRMMNGGQELPRSVIERVAELDNRTKDDKEMRLARNLNSFADLPPDEQMWTRIELLQKLPPIKQADAFGNVTTLPNPAWTPMMEQIAGLSGGVSQPTASPTGRPLTGVTTSQQAPAADTGPFLDPEGNMYPEGTKLVMPDGVSVTIDSRGHAIPDGDQSGPMERYGREDRASSFNAPTPSQEAGGNLEDLYGNAWAGAGIKAGLLRTAEGLPGGIGDYASKKTGGLYERVARSSLILQNDIVDGLRGADEKIANQYREELKKIVTIDPQIVNSTYKLRTTYRTFDKELRKRGMELQKIVDGKVPAGAEEKRGAAYAINAINRVISRMNVPQTVVNTREELLKLKPGEVFLYQDDPTPKIRTVKGWRSGDPD